MKPEQKLLVLLMFAVSATGKLHAQAPPYRLPAPKEPSAKNRVALSYRIGQNIGVNFKDVGGFTSLTSANLTPNGDPYNYDNGYVLPDISGSAVDTWYWGYDNTGMDPNLISLNRTSADSHDSSFEDMRESPELAFWHSVGQAGNGHWGWIGALNYTRIENHVRGTLNLSGSQRTDNYTAATPPPPQPPYYGTFEGPVPGGPSRPLISLTPTTSMSTPATATFSGSHEYEADLFGLRLGPYIVVPLARRLTLDLSGGLALGFVSSDYDFEETVTLAPVGTNMRRGSSSETDFLVGAYASLELWQMIGRDLGIFAGAQYQYLGTSTHETNGKEAELDLRAAFFISFGLGYAF